MMAKQRRLPELKEVKTRCVLNPWDLELSLKELFAGEDRNQPSFAKGFNILSLLYTPGS